MSAPLAVGAVEFTSHDFVAAHGLTVPSVGGHVDIGSEIGAGGGGTVFRVDANTGGKPSVAKVIDLTDFPPGFDAEVIAVLRSFHGAMTGAGSMDWPEQFLAVPYAAFATRHKGHPALALMMLDLGRLGYEEVPFAERRGVPAYASQHQAVRVEIARSFAEKAAALERIRFVHGDLNPPNLMFNPSTNDVQIIDFETGAVVANGHERPLVAGKPDDCNPVEIKGAGTGNALDVSLLTLEAERWSVGSLVGYCLFGVHPGFFLRSASKKAVDEYASQAQNWPDIDPSSPVFRDDPKVRKVWPKFHSLFASSPVGVKEEFREFFLAGSDGILRPTAADWLAAFTDSSEEPEFSVFDVSEKIVIEGDDVFVEWDAPRADFVTFEGVGRFGPQGSMKIAIDKPSRIVAKATNAFGTCDATSHLVHVVRLPGVDRLPALAMTQVNVVVPSIAVSVPRYQTEQQLAQATKPTAPIPGLEWLVSGFAVVRDAFKILLRAQERTY